MATSQFTVYSSSDASGPGLLTGQVGTLLALLDACLVNGYSGKAAAGWTKPIANSGNIGCYRQGSGAGLHLLVNDNGQNVTSTYKEAWMTGWETLAGVGGPVGTGTGQFPTPGQALTTGHLVCRKSATADGTGRAWWLLADASTFYLFVVTGDAAAGTYYATSFGDIFSLKGATDTYRCILIGRATENSTSGAANSAGGGTDNFDAIPWNSGVNGSVLASSAAGHFLARSYGGGGTSVTAGKLGDFGKMIWAGVNPFSGQTPYYIFVGTQQTPNGPDSSYYLSPVWVFEPAAATIRGRMRGLYHICHPSASFTDGQVFAGAGDFAGKSFLVFKPFVNGGFFALETSATVETN